MRKRITYLLLLLPAIAWVALTFYKLSVLQPIGGLLTYRTGLFSLTNSDGEMTQLNFDISGLGQLDIRIDSIGIPHIFGSDAKTTAFGLGYMHARDRYFQMELIQRNTRGRLAEILGKSLLSSDTFWAPFEFEEKAKKQLADLQQANPAVYEYLVAYNNGVRHYLNSSSNGEHAPEYRLLGREPSEWQDHYPLLLNWYMSYILAFHDDDLQRQQVLDNVPPQLLAELFNEHMPGYEYIIPQDSNVLTSDTAMADSGMALHTTITPLKDIPILENLLKESIGSNNWAVHARKTKAGKAILCNDTHLDITLPNPWYEAHLSCPDFHTYGFTIPSGPYVISGHNANIAWGITNGGWDMVDRFILEINPDNPNQYKLDRQWKDMEVKHFTLPTSDSAAFEMDVRFTVFGQVKQGEDEEGHVYARKWYASATTMSVVTFDKLSRAKDWNDFKEALHHFHFPAQNFVYADHAGNTGIVCTGKKPVRPASYHYNGGVMPGNRTIQWQFLPFDQLPHIYNPSRGYVCSANQQPQGPGTYFNFSEATDYRGRRISEFLANHEGIEPNDLKKLHGDNVDLSIRDVQAMLKKYDDPNTPWTLVDQLYHWDGSMAPNLHEPVLFNYLGRAIHLNFVNIFRRRYPITSCPEFKEVILYLTKHDTIQWKDTTFTTHAFLDQAVRDAANAMVATYGEMANSINYHEYTKFDLKHILRIPGLGRQVFTPGGNGNSPNAFVRGTHGPSMRTIIQMGDPVTAQTILAGGQSGKVNSPNFANQVQAWNTMQYHTTQFVNNGDALNGVITDIRFNYRE